MLDIFLPPEWLADDTSAVLGQLPGYV